jgi:predicted Zn-dependent protease with MMP-like domain
VLWSALVALCVGFGVIGLLYGFSSQQPVRFLQVMALVGAGALLLFWLAFLIADRMAGWRDPEDEAAFEEVVQRAEQLAADDLAVEPDEPDFMALDPYDEDDFEELIKDALDELPRDFQLVLKHVAVVVSDDGRKNRAYGLYHGDGVARDNVPDRIVIYRDTLLRDFGHDPDLLREQVTRTVLHELAHHLGWDEPGVRGLGL